MKPVQNKSNKAMMAAFQDLRRSSAAQPHGNPKAYSRKVKHRNRSNEIGRDNV